MYKYTDTHVCVESMLCASKCIHKKRIRKQQTSKMIWRNILYMQFLLLLCWSFNRVLLLCIISIYTCARVSLCIDVFKRSPFLPFSLILVLTFEFLYCCCCCICCHCSWSHAWVCVCASRAPEFACVPNCEYVYKKERSCAHGFGSLKIKISQSISDVFMFSSYIFVDMHICMLFFFFVFICFSSLFFCFCLFTSLFFMKCIHHVCKCVLLKSAFDYWYWCWGWCSLPLPIEINMLSMFFIITRCSEKNTNWTKKKKTSEISANHVESCTHKCACTKRIFTRQQRHTHDTRRRQQRCKQWKMVMEHFSNWA